MSLPRILVAWLGLVPLMIVNGIAREALYAEALGDLAAHQLSTATAIALLMPYAWFVVPRLALASPGGAWRVGLLWVLLTIAFEFGFGRFVAGHPWTRLVHDYDLTAGRVWLLFLLVLAAAPRAVLAVRGAP